MKHVPLPAQYRLPAQAKMTAQACQIRVQGPGGTERMIEYETLEPVVPPGLPLLALHLVDRGFLLAPIGL